METRHDVNGACSYGKCGGQLQVKLAKGGWSFVARLGSRSTKSCISKIMQSPILGLEFEAESEQLLISALLH